MNEELEKELFGIFICSIIGYALISWFFAIVLFAYEIYEMFVVPINNNLLFSGLTIPHNLFVQQYTPIPINQFIEDELILIVPPAIILGLLYYINKKDDNK